VIGLLDTSVVVDLLREYQPAKLWLGTQMQLGVTPAVWIEVLEGAPNKRKQQAAVKLLSHFDLIEMNPDDFVWATQALIKYGLSHNVDGYDCLIAAVSYRLNLPLYNRNMKHFAPILASLAVKPY
jgi:predicted nucleic acid-binding protein